MGKVSLTVVSVMVGRNLHMYVIQVLPVIVSLMPFVKHLPDV